jgi:hypothetical protein
MKQRENQIWAIGEIVPAADPATESLYRTLDQIEAIDMRDVADCIISTKSSFCQVADEPSAPLSRSVVSAMNNVFAARVQESGILRDDSEEL